MKGIVSYIKNLYPHIPIIAGGPYPTTAYTEILNEHMADIVVIGEGELTMLDIIEQLGQYNRIPSCIPGTAVLKGGIVKKNTVVHTWILCNWQVRIIV